MKKVVIKSIEVRDDRFPELYAIVRELQDRGEDISKIFRGLLYREFLPELLGLSASPVEKQLQAIATLKRSVNTTLLDLDFAEQRCRQQLGISTEAIAPVAATAQGSPSNVEVTETIEDAW